MTASDLRALVVEDDRSWQEILTEILTDAGLVVDLTDNLDEAGRIIRLHAHRVAVVDLSLGGLDHHNQDGLQVLDALRHHDPSCQAVLLTGFATVELAVNALTEHGALTCLRKEKFQRAGFRNLIERLLAKAPPAGGGGASAAAQELEGAVPGVQPVQSKEPGLEKGSGPALVVEDDAGWRSILAELLSDAGFRVQVCASYGEGLGYLRREKFSLAVIDLSLTGQTRISDSLLEEGSLRHDLEGYRLLASTRAGRVPTIVVSGVATPDEIERAYTEQGIFASLQKQTFNRQAFLKTVSEALMAPRAQHELDPLTEREREVLELLAQGLTNKEIAETLVISTNTVKRHLKAIFDKLDIHTRAAAAAKAISGGLPGERAD